MKAIKNTKSVREIYKEVAKTCNPESVLGEMLRTSKEREAGLITDRTKVSDLYELLKKYRNVPDDLSGTACGILTSKETWLLDSILDIIGVKRQYNSNIPD